MAGAFLSSHMMGGLARQDWQRLLAAFRPQCFSRGLKVLQRGTSGEHCYVIESGHALVQLNGTTLCHLSPGDFFGEDALVLNGLRNADVVALDDLAVHAIDKTVFVEVLLESLVQFVTHRAQGVSLILGDCQEHPDQSFGESIGQTFDQDIGQTFDQRRAVSLSSIRGLAAELDPKCTYYVEGGLRSERALCAFLLVQRGFGAHPVA